MGERAEGEGGSIWSRCLVVTRRWGGGVMLFIQGIIRVTLDKSCS